MPLNKPTISHQLKTVKSHRKASKTSAIIHSMPSVAFSPQTRSHLITTTNNNNDNKSKQNTVFNNSRNAIDSFNCMSSMQLKECTKLLRNVLTSEALIQQQLVQHKKNKSTSTDDFSSHKLVNTRSVAFKPTDLSSDDNNQQQIQASDLLDDRTDAESLSSAPEQRSTLINNNPIHQIATHSPLSNTYPNYCNCHSNNNNNPMHDSRLVHNSPDPPRLHEKISVCMRCHNVILPKYPTRDQDTADGFSKKTTEDCAPIKSSIGDQQYHGNVSFSSNRSDFKPQSQYHDVSCTDKFDDFLSFIHVKINELQSVARVTRDADLGRIICEIERAFQQIARENSTLTNHLKTITKTLKWENSALKQKMKNQTESNRDMKSELKLIRQEQKQKVEELKLEVQLKTEEIRHLTDRDKNNTSQLKEKCATLEKEHEKLRCEFQSQILQACHKDTEMIQLKHSCSQSEAKLKEEIHSLTLANQNLKQELNICQTQCRKYEQDINHNQSIIKAAREQVFSLLDRHKQNRVENSLSYRYDSPCDTAGSGEWIHQATNLEHVLSMAYDNKDKQSPLLVDRYKSLATVNIPSNYYSPNPNPNPNLSDQSNITNASNNNFATTNFNNNYMSSSSYNNVHSDSTNSAFIYESGISKKKSDFIDSLDRSQSPSNISSTLSNHSLNLSLPNNGNAGVDSTKKRSSGSSSRRNSESSNSDVVVDPWSLPQPFNLKKMSSVSSMMSTVSSLRSTDDREFRVGLKRLDTQISRLQNTLQSNLKCK